MPDILSDITYIVRQENLIESSALNQMVPKLHFNTVAKVLISDIRCSKNFLLNRMALYLKKLNLI